MAEHLLSDIIIGKTSLDTFLDWLLGKDSKVISCSFSRTDFALVVLKYIQDETNKFLPALPIASTTQQTLKDSQSPQEKNNENDKKNSEEEFKTQRAPFQVLNRVTPTRTTQPFPRQLTTNGYEYRRDPPQCPSGLESRHILTSTPLHPRRNSKNDHFPVSPPSSFHSDQSTPRSSKSSRFNSSPGSHHFSPNSPQSPPFSPSSPQYSDSFPDLGAKNRPRAPQSPCLGDFITIKPASQKNRKRIKPTKLSTPEKEVPTECKQGNNGPFGAVTRPFVPITSAQTEIKEQLNFDEERNLLKQKRIQILKSSQDNSTSGLPSNVPYLTSNQSEEVKKPPILNTSPCLNISVEKPLTSGGSSPQSAKLVLLDPDPSLVKSVDRIISLASVYSACLDANLVPNVTVELYNIFTLLTAPYKSKVSESLNSSKESSSSENVQELSSSSGHCNSLMEQLCLHEKSEEQELTRGSSEETAHNRRNKRDKVFSSVHDCVMFSASVLERQIHTLQHLDKAIIRLLIENARLSLFLPHFIPRLIEVAHAKEAKEAICNLTQKTFSPENGPVLYHCETDSRENFSSLENFNFFKKQRDMFYETLHEWRTKNSDNFWASKRFPQRVHLLLSLSSDPVNMMHLARLFCAQMTSLKNEPQEDLELAGVSRDKLTRLQARFVKPAEGGSPRPPPAFPAEQQFYQQFLHLAVGSTFLQHVSDCLVHRLLTLDHTEFFTDGLAKEEIKSHVVACAGSSCLVAKFLGLVTFLPYKSNVPLAPDTLQAQITVRDQVVPPVNLLPQMQRALATNRLVVTVPWVVAFLGMMDSVAPYIAFYRSLLQLLVSLYKSLPLPHLTPLSNLLLRCSLGWLFDASFFPQQIFSSLMSNCGEFDAARVDSAPDVDVRDVVDQALVSEVCPYLIHLRHPLAPAAGAKAGTARHITPVPVQLTPATPRISLDQTIELQLEESFLNGQSQSFRSTVETIIDRISSTCIKHICSNVIAPAKEKALEELRLRKEEFKSTKKQEVDAWVSGQCRKVEPLVLAAVEDHCGPRAEAALALLLGPDLGNATLRQTTHAVTARRCRDRVVNWLNSHVKLTDMFSKLVPTPESKPASDSMKPLKDRKTIEHKDSVTSPADMIIKLQNKLCECIESRGLVMSEDQVLALIGEALENVTHRSDLITVAENTIFTLSVDFCIVLLAHAPTLVTPTVVSRLCALWSVCGGLSSSPLERIMSARNTLLLCQGGTECARLSWQRLSLVLVELLKHSPPLLTPSQLEAQCVALFRLDWPPMVLTLMGACLSSVLEKIKEDPLCEQKPKFVLMLEWVNEMTQDLSREDSFEDAT